MPISKEMKRAIRGVYKMRGHERYDHLQRRQDMAARIARLQVDGYIAIHYTGHDCDHTPTDRHYTIRALPMAVAKHIQDTYMWADGPIYASIVRPLLSRGMLTGFRETTGLT